ncbi:MAG: phosphoribosylpyrophosphate synthetase [Chitinophagaceae bacterium]|nr:phosphoribosylpyrophosphate synthetase [Chitinophagaceae bacterium]
MENYDTSSEALNALKAQGYTIDFNLDFDKIICPGKNICLKPREFEITKVFRFEGYTNPADEEVVYAVESKDGKIKGVISSAYGKDADSISNEMVQKLGMKKGT